MAHGETLITSCVTTDATLQGWEAGLSVSGIWYTAHINVLKLYNVLLALRLVLLSILTSCQIGQHIHSGIRQSPKRDKHQAAFDRGTGITALEQRPVVSQNNTCTRQTEFGSGFTVAGEAP